MASALSPPIQGTRLQRTHAHANAVHVAATPTKALFGSTPPDERRGTYGSYSLRHSIHVIRPPPDSTPLNPNEFGQRRANSASEQKVNKAPPPIARSAGRPPTCSGIKATFGSTVNQTVTMRQAWVAAARP